MTKVMKNTNGELTQRTEDYSARLRRLHEIAVDLLPKYGANWHRHSAVISRREQLARTLYYHELYQNILDVPGVICEFGVQWGATLSTLINLRTILEPFNHSRFIYGFDTFEGFNKISEQDGNLLKVGDYSTLDQFDERLDEILSLHEADAPSSHIKKFELIKGDASQTVGAWLTRNPHAIISMAIFDMDLYEPTKAVLEKIMPRLTCGSILVFDELNYPGFPGETTAVNEVLGLNNIRLRRSAMQPYCAWAVFGE